jgi:hypothetical protein
MLSSGPNGRSWDGKATLDANTRVDVVAPIPVIRMWRLFSQIEAIATVRYSRRDRPPVDASGACG